MLKPEPMTKVVICGLNDDLSKVSNILSQTRLVHVENYAGEDDGFSAGATLDYGARVSEVLVRVRSLIKILDIDAGSPVMEYLRHWAPIIFCVFQINGFLELQQIFLNLCLYKNQLKKSCLKQQ